MNSEERIKLIAAIGLPLLVIIFYVTASLHFSYTPDDTYIYLQYAKNIIHGNGMSFNAGEPSYGFTSPLWLLLVSLGGNMGVDLYVAAKVMDLFLASISLAVFFMLAYEMTRDILIALLTTTVFSFNAWFLRWAGSGMETSLAVLLVLLTLWYCIRNEYVLATVFATLLTLVRPESFILMGVIVFDLYTNSKNKRRAIHMGGSLLVLYTVFLLPWFIYAYVTFGRILPNTGLAKAGLNYDIKDMLYTLSDAGGTIALTDGFAGAVVLILGVIFFFKKKPTTIDSQEYYTERFFVYRNYILSVLWLVGIVLFFSTTGVNVVSRYLLPVIPMMIITAFLLVNRMCLLYVRRWVYPIMIGLAILMSVQNVLVYHKIVLPRAEAFERSVMEYCFIPMSKWIRVNTPEGTIVLASDIGALGYFSDRKIIDAAGLISPEMIPLLHQGNSPYQIIERKLYLPFCTPDYIIHNAEQPFALKSPELEPLQMKMVGSLRIIETQPTYFSLYKTHYKD